MRITTATLALALLAIVHTSISAASGSKAIGSTPPRTSPTPPPTPTPAEEADLTEALSVVRRDFRFLRHEWSYSAIKYRGFLRYFAAPWRLVANFGGAYTVGGSVYFNRWSWEKALQTLAEFAAEMERYHRVYRGLRSGGRLRRLWLARYPGLARDSLDFVEFIERHSARVNDCDGRPIDGFLAPGVAYGGGGGGGNMTCELLRLAGDVVADCATGTVDHLPSVLAGYSRLSELAWDANAWLRPDAAEAAVQAAAAAAAADAGGSGSAAAPAEASTALVNDTKINGPSLSRQVLGHVLLYLRRLATAAPTADLTVDFLCRVVREDVDVRLARQLDARETAELTDLLDTCRRSNGDNDVTTAHAELLALWEQTRRQLWREYSAYRQYQSRIPAILSAKSAMRTTLPLIAAVGLLLNAAVALFYARRAGGRGGRNLLVALLTASDSAVLAVSLVSLFSDNYMEHNHSLRPTGGADLWCKFQPHLFNLAVETSAYLLVVLAVERFLAVRAFCGASTSTKALPPRRLWVLALSAFCAACILNCLLVIGDELAAPARSTVGRQCVQYVRLRHFDANLAYVTRAKPMLNAAARSLVPFSLVLVLSLATCRLICRRGAYRLLLRQDEQRRDAPELPAALGQLCLALAYLLLTAPAPVVHALFMTAHADRLVVKLTNGLVDESDPMFRQHWLRLGRLTVAQYVTEYGLLPASAACSFFAFVCTDPAFGSFVRSGLRAPAEPPAHQEMAETEDQAPAPPVQLPEPSWEQTDLI